MASAANKAPPSRAVAPLPDRAEFQVLGQTTYLVSRCLGAMPRPAAELQAYADTWASRGVRAWEDPTTCGPRATAWLL